jgi:hypothetical protein
MSEQITVGTYNGRVHKKDAVMGLKLGTVSAVAKTPSDGEPLIVATQHDHNRNEVSTSIIKIGTKVIINKRPFAGLAAEISHILAILDQRGE